MQKGEKVCLCGLTLSTTNPRANGNGSTEWTTLTGYMPLLSCLARFLTAMLQPPTDFFGRSIAVAPIKDKSKKTNKTAARKGPPGVTFRFNEGNSAAVRRNVKVSAFM
jgi:hypothetical protein